MTDAPAPAIELRSASKTFGARAALQAVSMRIEPGEMVALIGPSGAGKSTLMRMISGLIAGDATDAAVRVRGRTVQQGGRVSRDVRRLRAGIGFIFQQFNLVGRLPLITNVLTGALSRMSLPRRLLRRFSYDERVAAMRALDFVGMSDFAAQRASTLSGGQQQRGAVARAIVQRAGIVLADEPIASLDPESARLVMDGLRRMNTHDGVTIVVSVHQIDYAVRYCDRVIAMKDGRVLVDCAAAALNRDQLRQIYGPNYDAMDASAARDGDGEQARRDERHQADAEARAAV